jgi:Uma2 family endonuclease
MEPAIESTTGLPLLRLTRKQYEQMAEAGVFDPDQRVELLNGMVVPMTPQGFPHASVIARLNRILVRLCGDDATVAPQLPLAASDDSEPEPDLYVFARDQGIDRHPERALLVIEVAATSQRKDRLVKGAIYAAANVPEYWLIDVMRQVIEVYREPMGDHFGRSWVARPGDRIDLLALAGRSVAVDEVFGR